MKISSNMGYQNPKFQRRLTPVEKEAYTKTVKDGLRVLNKELGVIVHNSSVPSAPKQNLGIGSLLSKVAQFSFIPFLLGHGINSIQQEPDTHRSTYDKSPYNPQSLAKNVYMAPIERLATEEYGNLITSEDLQVVINDNYKRQNPNRVDYAQISKDYDNILSFAYNNLTSVQDEYLQIGLKKSDLLTQKKLLNEFNDFKKEHYTELEPMAIFEILAKKNGNENWKSWDEKERNLYNPTNEKNVEIYRKIYERQIDYFMFKQWFVEKEVANASARNKEQKLNLIGDSPVAYTNVEVWQNQHLFFDNLSLGCPDQRWDFAVLKPETIFNEDGSLGEGGKLIKNRYKKMIEASPGGIRIDHIIGLIDPFVYKTDAQHLDESNSGRLYSTPNHELFGRYARYNEEDYEAIIKKIIIPTAEELGVSKENIICEDLGWLGNHTKRVMQQLELGGMTVTEYNYRGRDAKPQNTIMLGTHDNQSFLSYTDEVFNNPDKGSIWRKAERLAEDTIVPGEDFNRYKESIATNKLNFMNARFTELFTSPAKKIQVFFTDLFGIKERYNTPGQTEGCWELRVPENYEEVYHENLENGTALNIPDAIARAIRNKGQNFINENTELLSRLDNFTQILKSKN